MSETWLMIQTEREVCAELFASLSPERWAADTWCKGWSVRDVAAHLVASTRQSPVVFFSGLAKAGFSFDKMVFSDAKRIGQADTASLAAEMASAALRRNHPPGPAVAMLGEMIVHSEDIRRPLELRREYPAAALVAVADFYKGSNLLIGAKRRISGLRLKATDDSGVDRRRPGGDRADDLVGGRDDRQARGLRGPVR